MVTINPIGAPTFEHDRANSSVKSSVRGSDHFVKAQIDHEKIKLSQKGRWRQVNDLVVTQIHQSDRRSIVESILIDFFDLNSILPLWLRIESPLSFTCLSRVLVRIALIFLYFLWVMLQQNPPRPV